MNRRKTSQDSGAENEDETAMETSFQEVS